VFIGWFAVKRLCDETESNLCQHMNLHASFVSTILMFLFPFRKKGKLPARNVREKIFKNLLVLSTSGVNCRIQVLGRVLPAAVGAVQPVEVHVRCLKFDLSHITLVQDRIFMI
jgi:hypothetical protein